MELILTVVAFAVIGYFIYSRIQIRRKEKKNRSDRANDRYTPPEDRYTPPKQER